MSRNPVHLKVNFGHLVAPREGRVSRNGSVVKIDGQEYVAPREGRVSRNPTVPEQVKKMPGCAPRGACE